MSTAILRRCAGRALLVLTTMLAMPLVCTAATTTTKQNEALLPRGVKLPKDVAVPNDTTVAIYFPKNELDARSYFPALNVWIEPGRALEEARSEVARKLFPNAIAADRAGTGTYGLLLVVHPEWSVTGGTVRLEMKYRVLDPVGTQLREGTQVQTAAIGASTSCIDL